MNILKRFISFQQISNIEEWRSWLLDRIFLIAAIISPIGIIYSYYGLQKSGNENLIFIDILVVIPFYLKFVFRKTPYRIWATYWVSSIYMMTTLFFFQLGPHYARSGWLVVAGINMTILGGLRSAPIAVMINILIMMGGYFWGNSASSVWIDVRLQPEIVYQTYITNLSILTLTTTILVGFVFDKLTSSYKELLNARNYISNIINSMPSLLVSVDSAGSITEWNIEAEKRTDIKSSDALGKNIEELLPFMKKHLKNITEAIDTRSVKRESKNSRFIDNKLVYEDITFYPLIANGVTGAVIRVDDITDRVNMEEVLIQSEKMLSVGGLAAGMAHEINNPLAGMMQTASVMKNRLTNTSIEANLKAAEDAGTTMESITEFMSSRGIIRMVNTIHDSGVRVHSIINNMLAFARKSDNKFTSLSLNRIIDNSIALASTEYNLNKKYDFKKIIIEKNLDEDIPNISCNESNIQQVIMNILKNGAYAVFNADKKSKKIMITTFFKSDTDEIVLEITDNGTGIPEENIKHIFDPFFTTKPMGRGTGLGLSISYFIITEYHKAKMSVKSTVGENTTFTITFPNNSDSKNE